MDTKIKILIFEPDEQLGSLINECLLIEKFDSEVHFTPEAAYQNARSGECLLCIIDLAESISTGFALANNIKALNNETAIIFLGKQPTKEHLVEAFRLEADDFIRKPFIIDELIARVHAVLRRSYNFNEKEKDPKIFQIGNFLFDSQKQTLGINDTIKRLTTKESELLHLLCQNANSLIDRNYALQVIWRSDSYFNARSMDVYITKLRRLLKDDPRIAVINVHGKGYKLVTDL